MIIQVTNEIQKALFDGIWKKVWDEKGFEHEHSDGDSFLLYVEGRAAGTIQFVPLDFRGNGKEFEKLCDGSRIATLKAHPGQVFVIDKFAIAKEFRSTRALDMLMFSLFEYAEKNRQLYAVALLDPLFYRLIRFQYHFKVEKIGARVYYKGADVIPILMDGRHFLEQKGRYEWYREVAAALGGN